MASRQADGLELQIILVRPEPRHGIIGEVLPHDRLCDQRRLIIGILHRFEPDRHVVGEAVGVECAIADRENVGQRGAALVIHRDTIAALRARRDQRLDRGHDADTDDHHLRGNDLAGRESHTAHLALALDAFDRGAEPHIHAMYAMLALKEARQRLARDPRQHAVERFEQHDLLAQLGEHRRRLQPDIAPADHHRLFDAVQLREHPVGIGAGADRVDADKVVTRAADAAGTAPRRPDQLAIADRHAIGGGHAVRHWIDRNHASVQQHLDIALGPEGGGADQNPLERLLARKILRRQRRALIGQFGLVAYDRDRPLELGLAQRDRRLCPAMARAHDHDVELHLPLPVLQCG